MVFTDNNLPLQDCCVGAQKCSLFANILCRYKSQLETFQEVAKEPVAV